MKKQSSVILNLALGVFIGLMLAVPLAFRNAELKAEVTNNKKENKEVIKYYAPKHPQQMTFAGEAVPLDRWDVKERFDRELLFNYYNQANMLFLMKLANRYFPDISERLKAAGVPDDFKYLCVAESNLLSGARSRVGATGFWQFMPDTAPGYGLQANSNVDERYDLIKSTDAATKYLKQAYNKFGNWTAAAASYNCGQGGYNAQVTYQGTTNYYDLLLPEETNRYIFRILAFKHIMENAEDLGFVLDKEDMYAEIPHRVVEVSSSISNLAQWARSQGTTYKMVKQMNPWIRGKSLAVTGGRTYQIKLPPQ